MSDHERAALAEGLTGLQHALTRHPMLRAVAQDTTSTPTQHDPALSIQHSDTQP
ncbi:hypothetical protein ACFWA4_42150 [Streptomyces sp. NPDC060011]|uniref:hypothetical protein n=1 Tax=Streptomyces sp. NPDC060011 TaxID=3347037 RepID=UPI00369DFDEA